MTIFKFYTEKFNQYNVYLIYNYRYSNLWLHLHSLEFKFYLSFIYFCYQRDFKVNNPKSICKILKVCNLERIRAKPWYVLYKWPQFQIRTIKWSHKNCSNEVNLTLPPGLNRVKKRQSRMHNQTIVRIFNTKFGYSLTGSKFEQK